MELNRRDFLKGAAGVGLVGATMGLIGCSSDGGTTTGDSDTDSTDAATPETTEGTPVSSGSRPTGYMCDEDWLGAAPSIADSDIAETKSFDVVVVGGGHAGTQAALAAAQEGATVAVIEKHEDGEIIYRGDDICSYNSQMLQKWGFGPYDLDEVVREYVRRANGRCNTDVIRSFVYNSAEMMDNLVSLVPDTSNVFDRDGGECIVQIAYEKPSGTDYPLEVAGYKMWATTVQTIGTQNPEPVGKAGLTGVSRLTELETYCRDAAEDLDAEWYTGHTALVCTQDADGTVTGVIAESSDGSKIKFEAAKGVILATGDFGANTDMVWELCSEAAEYAERNGVEREALMGMTDCDGSGHKIGCYAGGAIEGHPRPMAGDAVAVSFGPWGSTPCLWINSMGHRFANEQFSGLVMANSIRQPLNPDSDASGNFAIMDSKHMQYIQNGGLDHGAPNWGFPQGIEAYKEAIEALDPAEKSGEVPGLEIANVSMSFMSEVFVGNTAEEALQNAGYTGDELAAAVASVERYNEMCAAGVDTDYGKGAEVLIPINEAPFYVAAQGTSCLYGPGLNTLAGLVTNGDFQVLTTDRRNVIKGLYAVGNTMGQRYGNSYTTPSAGNNMGHAMTSGRVAGKLAAQN